MFRLLNSVVWSVKLKCVRCLCINVWVLWLIVYNMESGEHYGADSVSPCAHKQRWTILWCSKLFPRWHISFLERCIAGLFPWKTSTSIISEKKKWNEWKQRAGAGKTLMESSAQLLLGKLNWLWAVLMNCNQLYNSTQKETADCQIFCKTEEIFANVRQHFMVFVPRPKSNFILLTNLSPFLY